MLFRAGCFSMVLAFAACCASAAAAPITYTLQLHDGKISSKDLLESLGAATSLKLPKPTESLIDLSGDSGVVFVRHLEQTVGPFCRASINDQTLTVTTGLAAKPTDSLTPRRLARLLTTGKASRPVAVGGDKFGIFLPKNLDAAKPVVLLIHGADCDRQMWGSMATAMADDKLQVAYFNYADDGPIAEAGNLLADCFADLMLDHPQLKVNVVSHSMGGLVARDFVEGSAYRGGVERLILVGTPNHGSTWAHWRWALEAYQHFYEGKTTREWNFTRLRKEGNGPAGRDMFPDSTFMKALNARPRQQDVRYTIIAGDQSAASNIAADCLDKTAEAVPQSVRGLWGFRQVCGAMAKKSEAFRQDKDQSDGPVSIESAKLEGVKDFIVLHADHMGLACGYPPAAWATIRERLH